MLIADSYSEVVKQIMSSASQQLEKRYPIWQSLDVTLVNILVLISAIS